MPPIDTRPTLAFIDPGRRKAPFFALLQGALSDRFRCVYYSRRWVPRGFLRRAKVEMYPGTWGPRLPPAQPEADGEGLRAAIGAKAFARLGESIALRQASRYLHDLERFYDRYDVRAVLVWGGSNLLPSLAVHLARKRGLSVLFTEHGYLPGTTQVDASGVNFDSSATEAVASGRAFLSPDAAVDAQLDAIIAGYRAGNPMRVR
ncbi:MAG TPA: hypothetical protein VJM11_16030, partial [Nevskiaceae bacterium]|nr:hypothetical protein [Nevskiaceae bacterium]